MTDPTLRPGVTVVVCTFERSASLTRFLDSLTTQDRIPDCLIIVDASSDDRSERALMSHPVRERLVADVRYVRVTGALRGLPRQRNVALEQVPTDLVAFFDDDVVLLPGCLREMECVHRADATAVGVGALIQNEIVRPALRWRLRLLLGVVPHLRPGRYFRSGVSTPWGFLAATDEVVEGDWLSGCAAMWRTAVARETGYNPAFAGYANGEDLEFSLRARRGGRLVVAGRARALHLHDAAGRPDAYRLGVMTGQNSHAIHRTCLPRRSWKDRAWFWYAALVNVAIGVAELAGRGDRTTRLQYLSGYARGVLERAPRTGGSVRPGSVLADRGP